MRFRVFCVVMISVMAFELSFAIDPDPNPEAPSYTIVDYQMPTGRYHALNFEHTIQVSATVSRNLLATEEYQKLQLVIQDGRGYTFTLDSQIVQIPLSPQTATYSLSGDLPSQITSGFFTCIIRIIDISGNGFVWDQVTKNQAFIGLRHIQHFTGYYTGDFEELEYGDSTCPENDQRYGKLKSALGTSSSALTISVPAEQVDKNGHSHSDWCRGGGLKSKNGPQFREGFYVFRIKANLSPSDNAAANVWLYNEEQKPNEESITIELRRNTSHRDIAYCNVWVRGKSTRIGEFAISGLSTSYHEFIIEWEEGRIVWYHNGQQIAKTSDPGYIPSSYMTLRVGYVIDPFGWWLPKNPDGTTYINCSVDATKGGPYMWVDCVGY